MNDVFAAISAAVDTVENMNASLDKGVDAVVTNRPTMLGRVLQQRATS